MAITFNTNLAALGAQRNIGIASNAASSSLSKLSSGSRVPQAKDDAAGLAIGSKLKSEVAGLTQASNNAAQAISLLQIADGALSTLGDILQRMKALAVQSSSGQLDDASRSLLNQEFGGLQDEVTRVANLTNFNGTTLLAGSTKVEAKVNNLAGNLIGQGFDSIDFAQNFGDGAIKIDYVASTKVLTVTDLARGKTQSITLEDANAIATGDLERYNFGDIGVKIALNSNFAKGTDIAASTTVAAKTANNVANYTVANSAFATFNLTSVTAISSSLSAIAFTATGADALDASLLDGVTLTSSGGYQALTFDDVTIGSHVFTTTDTADTSTAGTFTFDYSDGQGNSFQVSLTTVTNASAGTGIGGTVTIDFNANIGAIQNTGTGALAPSLVSIEQAVPDPDTGLPVPYNFGNITASLITFSLTDAATAGASVTLSTGEVFNTTNSTDTVDLETTGIKELTLENANGDAFTIRFNVTSIFNDGDTLTIDLGQLNQLVGADAVTSGSTTFDFKVGTGVSDDDKIAFSLNSATATALGINSANIGTQPQADTAIGLVNAAITAVASRRADIGAAQSRLDFASNSISVAIENTTAAASALLDVDVSAEITKFTNQNVLMQAGISLLGQANQQPALLLRLLQ